MWAVFWAREKLVGGSATVMLSLNRWLLLLLPQRTATCSTSPTVGLFIPRMAPTSYGSALGCGSGDIGDDMGGGPSRWPSSARLGFSICVPTTLFTTSMATNWTSDGASEVGWGRRLRQHAWSYIFDPRDPTAEALRLIGEAALANKQAQSPSQRTTGPLSNSSRLLERMALPLKKEKETVEADHLAEVQIIQEAEALIRDIKAGKM